jgi:hypothetical protein
LPNIRLCLALTQLRQQDQGIRLNRQTRSC